tara:strand:- start:2071 stop:2586 length:516 start_codon:yes stop_codon:yes gene_type:complete
MALFDKWKTISGATCLNVFMTCEENKTEEPIDLVIPLNCALYLAIHWDEVVFSKKDNLEELYTLVNPDVIQMKTILIDHPEMVKSKMDLQIDKCNGSLAFCFTVLNAIYSNNEELYDRDLRGLFQECWEVMFWYINDLSKDEGIYNTINDFFEHHENLYKETILLINETNA